jgi:amino acid transporter
MSEAMAVDMGSTGHAGGDRPGGAPPAAAGTLEKNSVGVMGIVFFVIAAAAPLTVVVALFPVVMTAGNGIGIAGAFLLVALVLLLFSVGYVAMSRHITNAGAFYAYITKGLGRPLGLGSATLVIFAYNAIQLGLYGGIGFYGEEYVRQHMGIAAPWWLFSFIAMAASLALGVRRLHAGAMVLGVLLTLETVIIAMLDLAILFGPSRPATGFSMAPFSLSATFSGSVGVALMFAHASFIGFEGTAIYGEEARDPRRSVPRATYISVIFMGLFYAGTAWLLVNGLGIGQAVAVAKAEGGNLIFVAANKAIGGWATQLFQLFVITSMFAAILTFHNNVARYLFAMGRQGVLWRRLGVTHPVRSSPYIACWTQTGMVALVVAVFALAGLDPYATLFTWFTGIGAAGMILVQTIASIAIFTFFRRSGLDRRLWHSFVAPLLGIAGLVPLLWFALTSLDVLLGVSGPLEWAFLAMLLGSLGVGLGYALWLRSWRPETYAGLASTLDTQD